ncbi:MAG TPA: ABC transporter substrate-binding protein [Acidimicrobiia bacterium]|nr:ABC transporter substrate-binding protein [Acidimicrobiia bacterium]
MYPNRGRRARLVVLILALLLVAVACSSSDSGDTTTTGGTDGDTTTTTDGTGGDTTTTVTVDPGAPREGGTVVIGVQAESECLDIPNCNIHIDARAQTHLAYGQLMSAASDGSYVPYMLESATPNDDATVWTLTLREGLVFHDGTPFNAEALQVNFDRAALFSLNTASFDYYVSTEVIDDRTVEVTLNKPYAVFPQVLADGFGGMASPAALEAQGEAYASSTQNPPVGAGPYRMVEWVRDSHQVWEKFDDYAFDNRGWADRIEFRIIPDDAARAAALRAGDIDIAVTLSPSTIVSFRDDPAYTTHELDYGATGILFQVEEIPDLRIRQAVAMAIDKDTLIDLVWQGVGEPVATPFRPDNFWYADVDYPEYDPAGAAALVAEVEAETGQPVVVTLTPRIDETSINFGTVVVEQLSAVGMDASLDISVDTNDFVNRYIEGQYQMMGTGVFTVLDPWFEYTRRYESTSVLNGTGLATVYPDLQAEIDEMLAIGAGSTDPNERKAAYDRVQEILADNVLQLFIRSDVYGVIVSNDILGFGTLPNPDGSTSLGNFFTAIMADELWRAEN